MRHADYVGMFSAHDSTGAVAADQLIHLIRHRKVEVKFDRVLQAGGTEAVTETAASVTDAQTAFTFTDSGITVEGSSDGYECNGTVLTIDAAGTYLLSGSCTDGSVKIKKGTTGVRLILSGLSLISADTAPITCNKSSEVVIVAADGTENVLTDAAANNDESNSGNENAENAVIKCKDGSAVTLCGAGTLTLNAYGKNGIKSGATTAEEGEASLTIRELTLSINASVNDAINAEQYLAVESGTLNLATADVALHCDLIMDIGAEGTDGPTIAIAEACEGIEAAALSIRSGDISIVCTDDCLNAANSDLANYDFAINISGGTIVAYTTAGDGFDSNGSLTISGGNVTVWSGGNADNQPLDADGTITTATTPVADLTATDADVAARAAKIQAEIDKEYGTVFAKTEVALNGEKEPGNRTEETNLGDLICDALVWGAEREGTEVDAAVTNGGGIRASIAAGDITKKDINTVLPFGNTLSIVKVTGAELLEALEASTYCTPTSIGGFPQVSGIEFTVDTTKAYDQGEQYPGSTYYGPKSIQRVTIETVGGEPFDANATYTIATNDFMAAGGDTYYAFAAASVNYDLGLSMDEVVMDYITDELKGTVTEEAYGQPAGRITVDQGLAFTDVAATSPYYDGIEWAVDEGITNGTTATTFSPYQNCTRAQIITYLWRAAGSPEPASTEPAYTDVTDASLYFFKAVQWASEQGLVEGETFDPYAGCTRAMAVYFMWVAADSPEAAAASFTDVAADADYAAAVNWAVAQGVTLGTGDGSTFSPDTVCQRGQIVTFLYRAANAAA